MPRTTGSKNKSRKIVNLDTYHTVNDMSHDVRSVLKSFVNQEGRFSTKEGMVISKLYGNELTLIKNKIEAAKINTKNTQDVLTLG